MQETRLQNTPIVNTYSKNKLVLKNIRVNTGVIKVKDLAAIFFTISSLMKSEYMHSQNLNTK
jgi:hypothetical protein